MTVNIKVLENGTKPTKAHEYDACFDCYSTETVTLAPRERARIGLGFCLELPDNHEAVVRPRSGMSSKGIDCCIGTVDSNYRGEVMAIIVNNSWESYTVEAGDRICQLAVRSYSPVEWIEVHELTESERGTNGFGSSGR